MPDGDELANHQVFMDELDRGVTLYPAFSYAAFTLASPHAG